MTEIPDGMTKIRYEGPNTNRHSYVGAVSRRNYSFAALPGPEGDPDKYRVQYVDDRDLDHFLGMYQHGNKMFSLVEEVDAPDASQEARVLAAKNDIDLGTIEGSGADGAVLVDDVRKALDEQKADDPQEIDATPAARALAEKKGLDLATVTGTGEDGRIVKNDVLAALGEDS